MKRSSGLRRGRLRPMSERQQQRKEEASEAVREHGRAFREAIRGERCLLCGRTEREAYAATGWGHQAHHAIPKQTLKRLGLLDMLWDPRNAVAICEEPCHRRHTSAYRRINRRELPKRVGEFAAATPELRLAFELEYPE